jgi:hypothetical protein
VLVQGVDGNVAVVQDSVTKKTFNVSITNMPAKGVPPAPGEMWLVSRQYAVWAFVLCLNAPTALQISNIQNLTSDLATLTTATQRPQLLSTLYSTASVQYMEQGAAIASITNQTSYSTMLTTGSPGAPNGLVFIAPPSGIVRLSWGGNFRVDTAAIVVYIGLLVASGAVIGSGTPLLGIADFEAIQTTATNIVVPGARTRYINGLVSGGFYNAYIQWRTSGNGTGEANGVWADAVPSPQ